MVKTGKFILAIILLIVSILLVGCLYFTGSRLANFPNDLGGYEREVYQDEDTHFQFWEDGVWYQDGDSELLFYEKKNFEEGVLTLVKDERELRFVFVGSDTLYDESTNSLLVRSVNDG